MWPFLQVSSVQKLGSGNQESLHGLMALDCRHSLGCNYGCERYIFSFLLMHQAQIFPKNIHLKWLNIDWFGWGGGTKYASKWLKMDKNDSILVTFDPLLAILAIH